MSRGRMLNKKISDDEEVADLCNAHGCEAGLFWTWLIAHADVYGRFYRNPDLLKSKVAPLIAGVTAEKIDSALNFAEEREMVATYEVKGRRYLWLPKFDKNQVGLRKDRETSDLPPPPVELVVRFQGDPGSAGISPAEIRRHAGKTPAARRKSAGSSPASRPPKAKESKVSEGKETQHNSGADEPLRAAVEAAEAAWPGELSESFLRNLMQDYPSANIASTIRDAHTWEIDHPKRKKKRHSTFLRNWLKNNSPGGRFSSQTQERVAGREAGGDENYQRLLAEQKARREQ